MIATRLLPRSALRRAGVVMLALLLQACASLPQSGNRPDDWPQIARQLQALQQWRIQGRLGVQTATQGGSLELYWRQQGEKYTIRLIAPLGQGAVSLSGDADEVVARLANGQQFRGQPEALMQQHFDVAAPVSSLPYWLRGLPAPGSQADNIRWNAQQRIHRLTQNGWQVEMQDYRAVGDYLLPHKFYLEPVASAQQADGGDTSVKLVIRQWYTASADKS